MWRQNATRPIGVRIASVRWKLMESLGLTVDMVAVLCLLTLTVILFVTEVVRVDVTAIIILVALGLLSYTPGLENIGDTSSLFDGFSSNAVISIIAVMIIGAGLDKTGVMSAVTAPRI